MWDVCQGRCIQHRYLPAGYLYVLVDKLPKTRRETRFEVTYLYISGITTKPKQSECDVNSYNKDTIAICTCEGPDLMKQLIFQGYGVFICTKC